MANMLFYTWDGKRYRRTNLKSGDMVAINKESSGVVFFRPRIRIGGPERLFVDHSRSRKDVKDDKVLLDNATPWAVKGLAQIISACTGLGYEIVKEKFQGYAVIFRFI